MACLGASKRPRFYAQHVAVPANPQIMTQHLPRPPPYLQPRPKAAPTLSDTSGISKAKSGTPPYLSRPSSQSRQSSPAPSLAQNADASTKATRALIRRVFYPDTRAGSKGLCSLDELLPPLTSSNDIDLQLYAIIAIVIKDTVHSWYGKITPDQSFVEEVIQIVAHCTRAIEGRLRSVDLEGLVFDEIPQLIDDHIRGSYYDSLRIVHPVNRITAFRTAHSLSSPARFRTDPRVVYHDLNPHPALSPVPELSQLSTVTEQSEHETQYRQLLVQSALAILLPTEDLDNACLRTLVADVIAETILGNAIGGKLCEGYFIWGNMSKLIEMVKSRLEPKTTGEEIEVDTRSRLEKFGLLSERGEATRPPSAGYRSTLSSVSWRALQYVYLIFIAIRFIVQGCIAASARPRRSQLASNMEALSPITKPVRSWPPPPLINYKFFSLVSSVLDLPLRVPWLSGSMSLLQSHLVNGPLSVGATDGILDQ